MILPIPMFGLGAPEIILILLVLLLFFGKDKLPELARSIGKSVRELKSGFDKPADEAAKKDAKMEEAKPAEEKKL